MYSIGLAILIVGASGSAGALAAAAAGETVYHRHGSFQAAIIGALTASIGLALLSFPG